MMRRIITFILILLMPISLVYAYDYTVPTVNTSEPGTPYYNPNYDPYTHTTKEMPNAQDPEYKYFCNYKYYTYINRKVVIDIFDEQGRLLNPTRLVPQDLTFIAGTMIRLDINEETRAHWDIGDISVDRRTYRCFAYNATRSCKNGVYCNTTINWDSKRVYSNSATSECETRTSCSYWYTYNWTNGKDYTKWYTCTHYEAELITEPEPTAAHKGMCENKAKSDVQSIINGSKSKTSSYKVEYSNGNKIDDTSPAAIEDGKTTANNNCQNITVSSLTSPSEGLKQCTFSYNLGKTCMNMITAEVRYINSNSGEMCDTSKGEIQITNKSSNIKTNYFIPLDTKNSDKFKLLLDTGRSSEPLNKDQCSYIRNNYEDWQNLIVRDPVENTPVFYNDFTKVGDKYKYNKDHCYLKTSIIFPVEQKFYGQTEEYTALEGYGMYFRQIDISNPFPNGLKDNYYWNSKIYNKDNKKINNSIVLSTSFSNPTYTATLTKKNIDTIRQFNDNNTYTKWQSDYGKANGMNLNGSSNFIRTNGDIFTTQQSSGKDYYKIGCGPANEGVNGC